MSLQMPQTWEYQLVSWAEEALKDQTPSPYIEADGPLLEAAYYHCDVITRTHSRTFYMASGLLPAEERNAARALYAFCRVTDDIVDNCKDSHQRSERLEDWRGHILADQPTEYDPVVLAWADTRARYNIPSGYAEQLIDGVARDLIQDRYKTFNDLAEYSYGVASTVGLMAMHIIGFQGDHAIPYAIKLGVALQITNILRDVGEDWRAGRLYLPAEDLEAFGLTAADIEAGKIDDRWRAFMRFQIQRNRRLYAEAWPGISLLDSRGRVAIAAAADLYRAILNDIEAHDYNVFSRRAHVSMIGKLSRLPRIWWRNR